MASGGLKWQYIAIIATFPVVGVIVKVAAGAVILKSSVRPIGFCININGAGIVSITEAIFVAIFCALQIFIFLVCLCLLCTICAGLWENSYGAEFQEILPCEYFIPGSVASGD